MKKVLLSIVFISMMLLIPLQSVYSANATFISKVKQDLTRIAHKVYFNCKINTSKESVDGRAELFPGLIRSIGYGAKVIRAFGILIADSYLAGHISLNTDKYYGDWIYALVFSFNGYFHNYFYKAFRVFDMTGTAKFALIFYRIS
jgi:hypothetical protein